MRKSVDIPVTVKCRTGVDDNDDYEFLKSFISTVKDSGVKTFIIHARKGILKGLSPRQNRNIPPLNYQKVYSIKDDFPDLEIIINGGIKNISEAKNHLNFVDGVMLGRAAYDDPFMLSDIDFEIYSNTKVEISRKDLLAEYLDYVHVMTKKGYDPKIMLKHVFGLKKGEKDAKRFRVKVAEIMNSSSLVENKDELLSMV
jgi:tRNA-dihydrouridine synthase A